VQGKPSILGVFPAISGQEWFVSLS